jgi:hypothetical protein
VKNTRKRVPLFLLLSAALLISLAAAVRASFTFIDISKACNMGFRDEVADDKTGGWFDQGAKDFREMPLGEQETCGVTFRIIDPSSNNNKSCIILRGTEKPYFPQKAEIEPINRKAVTVCFLHSCGWGDLTFNQVIADYRVSYKDGTKEEIPLLCGTDITDWSPVNATAKTRVAFGSRSKGLNVFLWKNPYPDKEISSISFESKNTAAVPVLAAISFSDSELQLPEVRTLMPPSSLRSLAKKIGAAHPRLILTDEGLAKLKELIRQDPRLRALAKENNKRASAMISEPTVTYIIPDGLRLLAQSQKCLDRVSTLSLAYRLSGRKEFAERAKKELFAAAEFKDWNSSAHFLDTAVLSHAFAIGYDWLYGYLDENGRKKIREALIEKGLNAGLQGYHENAWWGHCNHNWNLVCNGGLGIGALAVYDEAPKLSGEILSFINELMPIALVSYNPDGGWGEGPGYWHFASRYACHFLASLESATGDKLKLDGFDGIKKAGMFRIYSTGPLNLTFNYADANIDSGKKSPAEEMFWMAGRFDEPAYAEYENTQLDKKNFSPFDIVWYRPDGAKNTLEGLPSSAYFRGVELAFFRSSMSDKNAVYAGFKGGCNTVNHCHLDLGTFILDSDGVRWAMDLGADSYLLPGYFDVMEDGQRWKYYRLSTPGHSTLVINGENQSLAGEAKMIRHESSPARSFAVCDLTDPYQKNAVKTLRGVALLDGKNVIVQDEIELKKAGTEILWGMITGAGVKTDNAKAVLSKNGKKINAYILSPEGAKFEIISTTQAAPQNPNEGTRKLAIRLNPAGTGASIAVVFTKSDKKPEMKLTSLSEW